MDEEEEEEDKKKSEWRDGRRNGNGGDPEREVSQHAAGRSLRREEVDPSCDRSDPGRTV